MQIINSFDKQDSYLTYEALKYLASLLNHKIIAKMFIGCQGLQVCSLYYMWLYDNIIDIIK